MQNIANTQNFLTKESGFSKKLLNDVSNRCYSVYELVPNPISIMINDYNNRSLAISLLRCGYDMGITKQNKLYFHIKDFGKSFIIQVITKRFRQTTFVPPAMVLYKR